MAKGLHYISTLDDSDFKKKFADQRRMILDSGKTAEAEALKVESMFKRAGIAAAGYLTAQQALSFGQDIIRVRGERQLLEQSFEVLLQSRAKANKMISEITNLAINSPLEMTPVANAAQTLLGFGVDATRVMPILGQLSDVSMGNQQRFESLALVYAQVQSAGKLMGQDLLQMINAGFNPLTIIADQTGKSVAQLKDEMSKGAISADMVTAAFERVTSEGGKFYQMTQKQADGIIGNQATFEDAIVQMKNKIGGNYEDIIKGGYKAATAVVENYEEIGDAIMVLIATYGTYRAALIVTNAAEKLNTMILRQAIVEKRLAAAAGITLTNAEAIAASKTKLLSVAKMGLVKSLKAVSSALLAHPYALVLAAVVGLGSGIYKFTNQTDAATKAQEELSKHLDEETTKLNKAHEAITKAKKGTEERKTAIDNFNRDYGKYLGNLLSEKSAVEDVALAYNQAKTAVVDYAIEKARESYMVEPQSNVDKSKTKLRSSASKWGEKFGDAGKSGALIADIDKIVSRLEDGEKLSEGALYKALGDAFAKQAGFKDNSYNAVKTKEVALELQREFGALQTARNEFESFSTAYRDASVTTTAQVAGDSTKTITTVTENLKNASEALAKAKQELEEAKKADADKAVVKAKQDAVDSAQKNYNDALELTGIDPKAAKKAAEEAAKAQKEITDAQLKATKSLYDEQTELKRKQITDKIKLMEFDRDETLKRLDEQIAAAKSKEEAKSYRQVKKIVVQLVDLDIKAEEANRLKEEQETLNAMLEQYQTYRQERARIEAKYEKDRSAMKNADGSFKDGFAQGNEDELNSNKGKALKAIDEQFAQREISFQAWMDHIANITLVQLEGILTKAEQDLAALEVSGEGDTPAMAAARAKVSVAKDKVSQAKAKDKISPGARTLKEWEDLYKTLQDINGEFESIGDTVCGAAGEIIKTLGRITSASLSMANSIQKLVKGSEKAIKTTQDVTDAASEGIKSTAGTAATSMSTIEKASVILTVISAALQIATAIADALNGENPIEKTRREFEALNEDIVKMKREAEINSKDFSGIFGKDTFGETINNMNVASEAIRRYNDTLEDVRKRGEEVTNDIWTGEGVLDGRANIYKIVKEWETATESIANMQVQTRHSTFFREAKYASLGELLPDMFKDGELDMEALKAFRDSELFAKISGENQEFIDSMVSDWDMYQQAIEEVKNCLSDVFGELGNTMTDALVDAFENGTDAAQAFSDSVSDMLEQMAKDMIYSVTLAPIFKKAQDDMLEASKLVDDEDKFAKYAEILKGVTQDAIDQQDDFDLLLQQYQDIAKEHGLDVFGPDDEQREASKRGVATASQESVDENNGRLTSIQGHTSIIGEGVKFMQIDIASIRDSMTFFRQNAIDQLTAMQGIQSNTEPIADMKQEMYYLRTAIETIRDKGVVMKRA